MNYICVCVFICMFFYIFLSFCVVKSSFEMLKTTWTVEIAIFSGFQDYVRYAAIQNQSVPMPEQGSGNNKILFVLMSNSLIAVYVCVWIWICLELLLL